MRGQQDRMRAILALSGLLAGAVAGFGPGCSSSQTQSALSGTCSLNSDCDQPLVCVFSRCHNACNGSSDCPPGERCIPSGSGADNVCQLPVETVCTGGTACPGQLVCGSDYQCRAPCQTANNCAQGQTCASSAGAMSACFDPGNPVDAPKVGGIDGSTPETGTMADGSGVPEAAMMADSGADAGGNPPADGAGADASGDAFMPNPDAGFLMGLPLSNLSPQSIDAGVPGVADGGPADVHITQNCGNMCLPAPVTVTQIDPSGTPADLYVLQSLTIDPSATLTLSGPRAIIIAASGAVAVHGLLSVAASAQTAGPGGYSPGANPGPGVGANGNSTAYAGYASGGGSFCGVGGKGASLQPPDSPGGKTYGNQTLTPLLGGSAGGWPCGTDGAAGGGAIQVASGPSITIGAQGAISAGGGGGGSCNGSGGGSGGAILLEAPTVTLFGALAANGGSGAVNNGASYTGSNATPNDQPAPGHPGSGGDGSAGKVINGADGLTFTPESGPPFYGAGGGGAGYIRINTASGSASIDSAAVVSPDPSTACATQGKLSAAGRRRYARASRGTRAPPFRPILVSTGCACRTLSRPSHRDRRVLSIRNGKLARERKVVAGGVTSLALVAIATGLAVFAGCGTHTTVGFDADAAPAPTTSPSVVDDAGSTLPPPSDDAGPVPSLGSADASRTYSDFGSPILDTNDAGAGPVPSNASGLFGPMSSGAQSGGPCLVEPEPDSLFPRNWLRPRFRWTGASGENLFELRVHAQNQTTDLVVYTAAQSWTMPKKLWDALRLDSNDVPLTVSIRGGVFNGGVLANVALGATYSIGIAPADAAGTIIYWTSAEGTTLKGFRVGDESVGATLVTSQVQQVTLGTGACMGCHTGAPDGEYSILSSNVNNWGDFVALVDPDAGTVGSAPPFLGAGARTALSQGPLGMSAVSKAHWSKGDHVMIGSDNNDLVWIDLEASSTSAASGTLARKGTQTGGNSAVAPAWTHDGQTIVYVASTSASGGRPGAAIGSVLTTEPGSTADLFTVPYANRQGGAIAPLAGASSPNMQEYYPAISPDDALVVFNECANDLSMYNQPQAEVYTLPIKGGTATRLRANSPVACSGMTSPGVTNSWPKWAPAVTTTTDGRSFYWIVFSSKRLGTTPQLFLTGLMVDGKGAVNSYGALYLWNQPANEGNHTPAWEYFNVPPPPPPPPQSIQ